MSWRAKRVTSELRQFDRKLYALEEKGQINIYRHSVRMEEYEHEGVPFIYTRRSPHYICSLTHNWKMNGTPVDWGLEPIRARFKAMDLWQRNLAEDLIKDYEKDAESKKRDFSNNMESFLYDFRSQFKKATADINTSTLDKTDKRRLRDGYY